MALPVLACPLLSGPTHLGLLEIIFMPAGKLIQKRLEEVQDKIGVFLATLGSQVAHNDLVVLHQVLVAYMDLPVLWGMKGMTRRESDGGGGAWRGHGDGCGAS